MREELIGKVKHYFQKIGVATLSIKKSLWKGDRIHILGHTTDLEQVVHSMEIDHRKIEFAVPGDDVALKVADKVRPGDEVYLKVLEAEEEEWEREMAGAY